MTEQKATKTKVAIVGDGRNQEKTLIAHTMELLNELEQYRALGTVKELKSMKENGAFTGVELAQLAIMQMRLKEYEAIGTVEELRVARDKQVAMKICEHNFYDEPHHYICPDCRNIVGSEQKYCEECGQKLNWEEV